VIAETHLEFRFNTRTGRIAMGQSKDRSSSSRFHLCVDCDRVSAVISDIPHVQ
jgi:cyclophilin family peptidyl-prolyl cis-trans isomerase